MTLSLVDRDGHSTAAAAEGQAALASGDTPRAREKFAEAGAALERNLIAVRRPSEKHLVRFLAATQYYNGGNYRKALDLCRKIERRHLPPATRPLFPKFFQDVQTRASSGYESGVRRQLRDLWLRKDYPSILRAVQEHPYVLTPGGMAFLRAVISENLANYRAAALFYADAIRLSPNDPTLVFAASAVPLTLPGQGKLQEAWDYVRHQLEVLSHPVTCLVASLLCFHRAAAEEENRKGLLQEQVRYFDRALAAYKDLPPEQQAAPEMRVHMVLGFEAAAFGLLRLGEERRARAVCDEAIAFEPNTPNPWVVRGMIRLPDAGALEDFRQAVALGDETYFPYYYLAHDALTKDDFRSALSWSQQALLRRPSHRIESQLYGWVAVCRGQLGAAREEIESLFRKAQQIDPGNEEVQANYRLFMDSLNGRSSGEVGTWGRSRVRGIEDLFLFDRESSLSERLKGANSVPRQLQEVGA